MRRHVGATHASPLQRSRKKVDARHRLHLNPSTVMPRNAVKLAQTA
jgi:hypothetical protein